MKAYITKLLLVGVMLTTVSTAQAQSQSAQKLPSRNDTSGFTTGYIAFGAGLSLPVGTFGSTSNAKGGFAQPGVNVSMGISGTINQSNFGVAFRVDDNINHIDASKPISALEGNSQPARYNTVLFMGGGFATVPVRNVSFDFKLLAGLAAAQLENSTFKGGDYQTFPFQINYSFAYGGGFNIRYNFPKKFCALISTNIVHTNLSYTGFESTTAPKTVYYSAPATIVGISLGVGCRI